MKNYKIKKVFKLGGLPGYLLFGYYVIQFLFARSKSDMAAVDLSAMIFAAYALGTGLYSFINLSKGLNKHFLLWSFTKSPIKWFGLYTLLCLISALWSPNLVLSAYRAVECIGLLLLNMFCICYLVQRYNFRTIMLWSVTYAFLNLCLTFLAGIIQIDLDYAFYKCQFPSTIFFYLAFYCAPKKYIKYPMMLIAFMCKSVTGYCGMTLGMCSFMFGNKKYRTLGVIIAISTIVAMSTMGTEQFLNNTIFASKGDIIVNGQIDKNKTSGRFKIWENANEMMVHENRQWHGFGFVVGEMIMARELIGEQVIGMHNGFLSAYVGSGYIGLFLFILFMAMVIWLAYRNHIPKEQRQVLIACVCVILVHTYGNPGLGFRVYGTWMPAMFIIMLMIGMEYKSLFLKEKKSKS